MFIGSPVFRLEVFNSVILHHLPENAHLIYAILQAHKTFEELGTFTLARGLREIRRVQLAKEEPNKRPDSKNSSPRVSSDVREPQEEKARLLESEGNSEDSPSQLGPEGSTATIPVVSPTADGIAGAENISADLSEKARGKMKARRSGSLDISLERIAATGVGRNGFVPTQEWVILSFHFQVCGFH